MKINSVYQGDCLEVMREWPDCSVDCCVTSPPYWGLRDYGNDGQIGLEPSPDEYIAKMVAVFAEVRRVLKPEGTCWLNLGDSYAGVNNQRSGVGEKRNLSTDKFHGGTAHLEQRCTTGNHNLKPKDLCMIPARVALALQADGWWLRSDIIWHKPNPMPESVTDRPTSAHEHIFLLTKSAKYWYDAVAIAEPSEHAGETRTTTAKSFAGQATGAGVKPTGNAKPGSVVHIKDTRNARNVWTIATKPYSGAHFAVFPPELPRKCILAGCPEGGVMLDPFFGSGTTGMVAEQLGRKWIGIELNPEYITLAKNRTMQRGLFAS